MVTCSPWEKEIICARWFIKMVMPAWFSSSNTIGHTESGRLKCNYASMLNNCSEKNSTTFIYKPSANSIETKTSNFHLWCQIWKSLWYQKVIFAYSLVMAGRLLKKGRSPRLMEEQVKTNFSYFQCFPLLLGTTAENIMESIFQAVSKFSLVRDLY